MLTMMMYLIFLLVVTGERCNEFKYSGKKLDGENLSSQVPTRNDKEDGNLQDNWLMTIYQ